MSGKIKLNPSSGGGSFSLQAPSSSSNNRVLTLPDTADGTIAKTSDISFTAYAVIADQKTLGTDGGTFTSGAWRTRDLNTEVTDVNNIVSISSNQFTLQAGTYLIKGSAPAFDVDRHAAWVYDVTAGANVGEVGANAYANNTTDRSFFQIRVTISSANVYEIRHRCNTSKTGNGFGVESNSSHINRDSIYTVVEIYKEA